MEMKTDITSLRETIRTDYNKPDPGRVGEYVTALSENKDAQAYLEGRGLTEKTIKHFGLGYSEYHDAISIPIIKKGEVVNIKYRFLNPKDIRYTQESGCETWVFHDEGLQEGMIKGGVLITEGEFDAMSLWQQGITNVISPSSGKDSYGLWLEMMDRIKSVYLCYDNDEPGKNASKKLAERIGIGKTKEVFLPEGIKDANQLLVERPDTDFKELLRNAAPFHRYDFTGLVDIVDYMTGEKPPRISLPSLPFVQLEPGQIVVLSGESNVGKCHGKGTKILMFDGTIKSVEDVVVGDELMGINSKPRKVLSLANGVDDMYRVHERGEYYDVNKSHILSLKKSASYHEKTVEEMLELKEGYRETFRGWKTGFDGYDSVKPRTMDPYLFGLWLGDGTSSKPEITTEDESTVGVIYEAAEGYGLHVNVYSQENNNSNTYAMAGDTRKKGSNGFLTALQDMGVLNNKHIPLEFKMSSISERLELLAGLIDTDGYLGKTSRGETYEITQKNKELADDIVYLCRSLGFRATCKQCTKTIKSIGFSGQYYRINIVGDLGRVPARLERKQSNFKPKKHYLTSKLNIESIGVGNYYGFTLDGDGLYLLGSFTVTHNTSYALNLVSELSDLNVPTVVMPFERGTNVVGSRYFQVRHNIDYDSFRNLDEEGWKKVRADAINQPVYFTLPKQSKFFETLERANRIFNPKVYVIDHLDYLIRRSDSKGAEIGKVLQELKTFAEQTGSIFIIVHHLKKIEVSPGGKKRKPVMEDLKDSSSLYQDPEAVILLHKPSDTEDILTVMVPKNKGPMGERSYMFNASSGTILGVDPTETEYEALGR